jgi:hypothetical protein
VARIDALNWSQIANELNEQGNSLLKRLLTPEECVSLSSLYPNEDGFRSRVVMGRHGFGRGEYKYFSYPLPGIIQGMRTAFYRELAPIANHWNESLGIEVQYPKEHTESSSVASTVFRMEFAFSTNSVLMRAPLFQEAHVCDQLPSDNRKGSHHS